MSELRQVQRLVDLAGVEAALRLCGFYGGQHRRIRIPSQPHAEHPLRRLIGDAAFERLVSHAANKLVAVPAVLPELEALRTAGRVVVLHRHGVAPSEIARLTGMSRSRVSEILSENTKS